MIQIKTLNQNYSTTKLCYKLLDNKYLDEYGKIKEEYKFKLNFPEFGIVDSKIPAKKNEKFDTYLFLPEGEGRKGEGGLRTKGYFKFSYEKKDRKWYIVENYKFIKEVNLDKSIVKDYEKLPLISIITVVFNGEKYLEKTIQSVINQTYPNVEYIIIDGGSTDGTLDIIKKYEDYIDYWVSEKDRGIYDAMNKGIDLATGRWINFMNAGDKFYNENVVERIFSKKNYIGYKIIYGDVETIYDKFKIIHKAGKLENLYRGMQFSHQSTFFDSTYHKENKYYIEYDLSADFFNLISLYFKEKDVFYYLNYVVSSVNTYGISEKKIFNSVFQHWKAIKYIKRDNLYVNILYILNLIKQYFKLKFLNIKVLNLYRKIKYKVFK